MVPIYAFVTPGFSLVNSTNCFNGQRISSSTTTNVQKTSRYRVVTSQLSGSSSSTGKGSSNNTGSSSSSGNMPPTTPEDYQRAEMLDDAEASADMLVWNNVIHASLKRKLQGLVAESPVTNGVSALLHTAPGHAAMSSSVARTMQENDDTDRNDADVRNGLGLFAPDQVVSYLLTAFKRDALSGAAAFVNIASEACHVKHTSPQTLVLFIGDNESYRPLLRVTSFFCGAPRFERSGTKCVITAEIHSPDIDDTESAKFDFQLSTDSNNKGSWFIDEVFRL